ncbi:hypothetical protein BDN72DRAFT_862543 [Pluteus cervinus]|uniref:Uncharacterized protein n=1 Tax=Pluteus cervinus TaxID=181527 RepID=A0ACD3AB87_9AGAR|nr:hypothetical protein BDN72DRAFT_862543 [Pluteus cervinus]
MQAKPGMLIPLDCLTEVFFCARDRSGLGHRSRVVIKLSWVCHSWRDVIRGNPNFWNVIDVSGLHWLGEFLTRSKKSPLSIFLEGEWIKKVQVQITPLLIPHLGRIWALRMQPQLPGRTVIGLSNGPEIWQAPALRTIYLSQFSLPFNAFHSQGLKHVSLHRCQFDWSSAIFSPSLTSLKIWDPPSSVNIPHLLQLLDGLPALKQLLMSEVVCSSTSRSAVGPWSVTRPRVKLPSLVSIELAERDPSILEAILSSLDLSRVVDTQIAVCSLNDLDRLIRTTLASVSSFYIREFQMTVLSMRSKLVLRSHSPSKSVTFTWECKDCERLIWRVYEFVPVHQAVTIGLDYIDEYYSTSWLDSQTVLAGLPFLEQLSLMNGAALDFFDTLPTLSGSFDSVRHWIFELRVGEFQVDQVPDRPSTDVLKLCKLYPVKADRSVGFKGTWWALEEEEIKRLASAGWNVWQDC